MELTEKTIESSRIFEGRVISVRRDIVSLPDGGTSFREIVDHHGGVCVAPLTDKGNLIFVRQFRYAYEELLPELPAGKLEKGEDPFEAGKRELEEETGMVADEIKDMGVMYPTPGYCNEKIHLYFARGLHPTKMHLDEDEFLEPFEIPLEKAVEMVMNNEITDGKSQILILKIDRLLREGK